MKKLLSLFALTACLVLANVLPASARPVKIWYPNELWEKADLVVMATVESSQDAYKLEKPEKNAQILVLTKFNVYTVLKGNLEKKSNADEVFVTVRHYRWFDKMSAVTVIDGPGLVEFNSETKNYYLIFLKSSGDSYSPLTGQYDPALSFLQIKPYERREEERTQATPNQSDAEK